ncbi:MAG TPA: T9SS type A sorting domain-containing protein [Bacteroidetes bacterium]|nr:T9SS type A sorting domain-containing protein [Bacteroidota bacterium]
MKKTFYSLLFSLTFFFGFALQDMQAQCTNWIAPTDTTGWTDFNSMFGGAPCDDGNGCPFNEINSFEVFAAEAYNVDNFIAGGNYSFSICNGPGAGSWVPEFTIIAPSGAVDAFGPGDGDGCTISWTATESGTYLIVINEAGQCGGGDNTQVGNGFPALTCSSGAPCDPAGSACNAGAFTSPAMTTACPFGTFDLIVAGDSIPNSGGFGWQFSDLQGGTGAISGGFTLTNSADSSVFNSDLNGVLSINGLPPLGGTWVVYGVVYSDATDAVNTICSTTADSVFVTFSDISVISVVDNMDGTATVNAMGGDMPYTYLWSNNDTAQTAIGLETGFTYGVTVTDANGCTDNGSVAIGEIDPCPDWINPTDTTGWTDFNSMFGGAPCDDGNGCPFNEINSFEVFAAEAYSVDNFIAGGIYSFSICNGPGAGSWVPEFTIIAPSGAVDAFGLGDGDGCTITWTASESGTYLIVINEAGQCGGGDNTQVGNGFPALTCFGGALCDVTCEAGTLTTSGSISVCSADATFDLNATGVEAPSTGAHGWLFDNNTGGTGALEGAFVLTSAPNSSSYDSDLNGILSSNNFPLFEGTWVVKSVTYSDSSNPFNSICSISTDSLVVTFAAEGPSIDMIEDNGNGGATVTVSGGLAPYSYLWSDDNMQTTETASDLGPGTYSVTVTDANGCTATASVDVISTGVGQIEGLTKLAVLPNPTKGLFNVQMALQTTENVRISVLDITGKTIEQSEKVISSGQFDFDMSGQSAGVYLLKITVGDDVLTRRLVLAPR